MRKVLWITLLSMAFSGVYGQKSIDALFSKYADADGFVTVTLNGSLLKLAHVLENDKDHHDLPGDINEIRILAQEDESMKIENFYDLVIKDINLNDYEEFMRVKEKDQD